MATRSIMSFLLLCAASRGLLPAAVPSHIVATASTAPRSSRLAAVNSIPRGGARFIPRFGRLVRRGSAIEEQPQDSSPPPSKGWYQAYVKASDRLTNLFPLWTVLMSAWGLSRPQDFAWLTTEYFTAGLAILMLSMGITLTPRDFLNVASRPGSVFVNFALCYGFMPALALGLGKAFGLEPAIVAGMVLVGSINGGQASNLCTYIAKGNVALSVLMTTATTIGAIFMTPLLCQKFLGAVVPVDALGIVYSTLQVVLGPIVLGMTLNVAAPKVVKAVKPVTPLVGVVSTCLLVASSVGQVAEPIKKAGLALQIPIFLIHFLGGVFGYWIARALGFSETICRTMAIETSMKSSAFGFLLAKLHFGSFEARVPSAVSVVWMALVGSSLAVAWRFLPVGDEEDKKGK